MRLDQTQKTLTWVIGAGGMLGSALTQAIEENPEFANFKSEKIPWGNVLHVRNICGKSFSNLIISAERQKYSWAVVWAAGAGTIGVDQKILDLEVAQFSAICDEFTSILERETVTVPGTFFFSSSAGGVYGGASGGPFDECVTPAPISPYGEARLAMENVAKKFSGSTGVRLVVGRIANLYGPGQNLSKPQGLVSQLIRAQFVPKPLAIFVPLDTRRDYIYVADSAAIILGCVQKSLQSSTPSTHVIKNIISGSSTTISTLLGLVRHITKKRPNVALVHNTVRNQHALDITLTSHVWKDLDVHAKTLFPEGIKNIIDNSISRLQKSALE